MKKLLLYGTTILLFTLAAMYFAFNEKLPKGENSKKADELATKMLTALNKTAWDSTNVLAWTSTDGHDFVWHKKAELVQVKWGKNNVLLNLKEWNKGEVLVENKKITDESLDVIRGKAWALFCNDSFWLIAPYKIFDAGVSRTIVVNKDGSDALLVSYATGGVTPGDSYLWVLDKNYVPTSYKMWVKIIPIGGVPATWENWTTTETGAIIATKHKLGPVNLTIENLRTGQNLQEIGVNTDLFDKIK